jgi:NodT family efflux transporter outer membrane factor (OMF) lipoprotein
MKRLALPSLLFFVSGCNFVPPHQAPKMDVPARFKESEGWKVAKPADTAPRGAWWSIFHDSELDAIMRSIEVSNQSLQAAAARAEQTAALLKASKMAFLPTATVNSSFTRSKSGAGGGSSNINSLTSGGGGASARNIYSTSGSMNWEMDLWGRLRHGAKAAVADAEAANADVESLKLSLQAQAAQAYFSLRASEAQRQLLEREVANYQKSLDLTKNREAQGVATKADVAQAQTQLASNRANLIETGVQRATFEHALAALTGKAPADFSLKQGDLTAHIPSLPSSTPSSVLQRRPDIAAAERRVAAANERLGAARAAFFPSLSLSADTGWRGLTDIFTKSNNFWSLGADTAEAILDSGKRIAQKEQAMATWKEMTAEYRQTALTAFQEAEDQLSTLRILAEETVAQDDAIKAARENERIAKNQYEAGTLSYLNVATAQAAALSAERNAIDLRARRLAATVALVKALGGSW